MNLQNHFHLFFLSHYLPQAPFEQSHAPFEQPHAPVEQQLLAPFKQQPLPFFAQQSLPIMWIIAPITATFCQKAWHPTHGIFVNGWCSMYKMLNNPNRTNILEKQHLNTSISTDEPSRPTTTNLAYYWIIAAICGGMQVQAVRTALSLLLNWLAVSASLKSW